MTSALAERIQNMNPDENFEVLGVRVRRFIEHWTVDDRASDDPEEVVSLVDLSIQLNRRAFSRPWYGV